MENGHGCRHDAPSQNRIIDQGWIMLQLKTNGWNVYAEALSCVACQMQSAKVPEVGDTTRKSDSTLVQL